MTKPSLTNIEERIRNTGRSIRNGDVEATPEKIRKYFGENGLPLPQDVILQTVDCLPGAAHRWRTGEMHHAFAGMTNSGKTLFMTNTYSEDAIKRHGVCDDTRG